ncbi:MAG TPA: tetratricopeptide repeat-containing protein, partial [Chloroflexi bacterium]|nr:tetratricopeptide repeat-containing protein [Chloroflexota bacterium]
IEHYEQALAIAREIGDRRGEGIHLGNLGNAWADLGEVRKAIDYYEQALAIAREIGDRRGEGNRLVNMGLAYWELGDLERARRLWRRALEILEAIEDPYAPTVRRWLDETEQRD